jgi:hemoglobin
MKRWTSRAAGIVVMMTVAIALSGCGSSGTNKANQPFHTSGSREADQRAEQRIAKDQQMRGQGTGRDTQGQQQVKKSLFERLGGETGVKAIVDDFVTRAMNDPRVNWTRKGVEGGSILHHHSVEWNATPANVEQMKKHIAQFLSLATGGPTHYDGKEIKNAHADMKISNAEFDAAVGDLKATLDKLSIGTEEQKELLAIIESTRPQIVEER